MVLFVALAGFSALAAPPESSWLAGQPELKVGSRTAERTVYVVKGNGDALFKRYRDRLGAQGWRIVETVWSGPARYLRATRGKTVVDVTLVNGKKSGKLTVVTAESNLGAAVTDRVVDGYNQTGTYPCKGGAFVLNGDNCQVVVTGRASIVRINGSHNTVKIRATTATILIKGSDNLVRWLRSANKRRPVITNLGRYNDIARY
jgi:hypothetical protein